MNPFYTKENFIRVASLAEQRGWFPLKGVLREELIELGISLPEGVRHVQRTTNTGYSHLERDIVELYYEKKLLKVVSMAPNEKKKATAKTTFIMNLWFLMLEKELSEELLLRAFHLSYYDWFDGDGYVISTVPQPTQVTVPLELNLLTVFGAVELDIGRLWWRLLARLSEYASQQLVSWLLASLMPTVTFSKVGSGNLAIFRDNVYITEYTVPQKTEFYSRIWALCWCYIVAGEENYLGKLEPAFWAKFGTERLDSKLS